MKYCAYCGASLNDDLIFCPSCGKKVVWSTQESEESAPSDVLSESAEEIYDTKEIPVLPDDIPFQLQTNEKIYSIVKPEKNKFIIKFTFSTIVTLIFIFILLVIFSLFKLSVPNSGTNTVILDVVAIFVVIFIVIILLSFVTAVVAYNKYYYWITNHRVIGQRGIIGYVIDSIPLENVADVIISRQILDRLIGISTLVITPIGGRMVGPSGYGYNTFSGSNVFQALLPDKATELQHLIFNLRDLRKKNTGRVL